MSWPIAIVLIVMLVIGGGVLRSRYNAMSGHATDADGNPVGPAGPSPREAELENEVEQMRERIAVLEKIATEDREAKRISREIDELRKD